MAIESTLLFETPEQIYARVFQALRPRTAAPRIEIEFKPFANANSSARWHEGVLSVRMSDVLRDAPAQVLESLAYMLLSKMFRRPVPGEYVRRYHRYLQRREVRETLEQARVERGWKIVAPPRGYVFDLEQIFDELNFRYFFGLMAKPSIGWSRQRARGTLGHYDDAHNMIVISSLLDSPFVPKVAVEYVLFHEMLHVRYPVEHRAGRRCVHTREFKQAEKEFEHLAEAKKALTRLPR